MLSTTLLQCLTLSGGMGGGWKTCAYPATKVPNDTGSGKPTHVSAFSVGPQLTTWEILTSTVMAPGLQSDQKLLKKRLGGTCESRLRLEFVLACSCVSCTKLFSVSVAATVKWPVNMTSSFCKILATQPACTGSINSRWPFQNGPHPMFQRKSQNLWNAIQCGLTQSILNQKSTVLMCENLFQFELWLWISGFRLSILQSRSFLILLRLFLSQIGFSL